MIDTVCLLIPKNKMRFLTDVSSWELHSKTEHYLKFVRNPSKMEKSTGKYFPKLTGYRRNFSQEENVRIEFSAPKLLYLNNLDELQDHDFPIVVGTLVARLKDMGVILTDSVIRNASVSSVHFSKNILLQGGYTASHVISEINKIDLRKSFDFSKTRFMNNGQSLYAHTNSHQFVIYDKVADLNKGLKRAIDKEQTIYQRSLFDEFAKLERQQEIVRFEVRLNHKQKMNKVIESIGYTKNPTFEEVFNTALSKLVLLNYWEKIVKANNHGLLSITLSLKDALQEIFLADAKIKPKQAVYLLGLYALSKDEDGTRQLRRITTKRMHERSWYRMAHEARYAGELIAKNNLKSWVKQIDCGFKEFIPFKTKQRPPNNI